MTAVGAGEMLTEVRLALRPRGRERPREVEAELEADEPVLEVAAEQSDSD